METEGLTPQEKLYRAIFGDLDGTEHEEHWLSKEGSDAIDRMLTNLAESDERGARVISLRFGFEQRTAEEKVHRYGKVHRQGSDERTLEEVSVYFGVTRERIRQIEQNTLRELRRRHRNPVRVREQVYPREQDKRMRTVMVSGHFDPPVDAHLEYIKHAMNYGDFLLCVVASDKQSIKKKGKVHIPDYKRADMLSIYLSGLNIEHKVVINYLDKDTGLVARSLRWWHPDVFVRGSDKALETMPSEERRVCEELDIRIEHAVLPYERHSSEMGL